MTRTLDKVVIALGYFDSVHVGHREVIKRAKTLAEKLNSRLVVFTFSGNLKAVLNGEEERCIYSSKEREILLKELGVSEIYFAPTDLDFLSLGKLAFLNKLNRLYNISGYVCGRDYKFGRFAKGSAIDLERYANSKGQELEIVDFVNFDNEKVSTSIIKKLISQGEIEKVNVLLGKNFFILGEVFKDRGIGSELGFPTVNIKISPQKQMIKSGVYAGKVKFDGKIYKALINVGGRPTFNLEERLIEAHLIDFDGDLYGKTLIVEFDKFIRELVKFDKPEKLKEQIEKDKEKVN
ncbi:MAG: riboflavin biosynthesis protein RibF [Clostridia bacterium]|nr:riboflavin biosynthesis protein RibF [Clostridia bacterium]